MCAQNGFGRSGQLAFGLAGLQSTGVLSAFPQAYGTGLPSWSVTLPSRSISISAWAGFEHFQPLGHGGNAADPVPALPVPPEPAPPAPPAIADIPALVCAPAEPAVALVPAFIIEAPVPAV